MTDAPHFNPALLREFALCFVEAAVTRLLEESETERNCMIERGNTAGRTNSGPELYAAGVRTARKRL